MTGWQLAAAAQAQQASHGEISVERAVARA